MSRVKRSLWLLAMTAAVCLMAALHQGEPVKEVRMLQVASGDVEQIAALTGRLCFQDERMIFAGSSGLVSQVYVSAGDRVSEGAALLRLHADAQEAAVSAWISSGLDTQPDAQLLQSTVVRAPVSGTVRQVLTVEQSAVTAGMPVVMISSASQEIRCMALEADAVRLAPGMQARLQANGDEWGRAVVTSVSEAMADAESGRLLREVRLVPDEYLELPEGAAVDVDVTIAAAHGVSVLPLEAISEAGTVWWVHDGRCTEIPAEIVLSDEMQVWVALGEGMTVAIGELKEGQRVAEVAQ